ncbi:MAG TPA: very short patch repair endonuclease [Candidatus Paceibacterota bacterium]|nr:very short patch repair endonuclease [Candidatus Paceibacterota bacterium]
MDNVSSGRRSEIMRLIKSRNSGIEKSFQKQLKKSKLKFTTHVAKLPGRPDIVFSVSKTAIFIDSCFWHGCKTHCRVPKTNRAYWTNKIERNKKRDRLVNKQLKSMNWKVLRIWEHRLKSASDSVVKKVISIL